MDGGKSQELHTASPQEGVNHMSQDYIEITARRIDREPVVDLIKVGDVTELTTGGVSGGVENKRQPYS
jgi:hypothetical protein